MDRCTEAWRRAVIGASVPLCVGASLLSCKDPRSRPAPPIVDVSVAPSFLLTSPDTIIGSMYAYDEDGLDRLTLSIRSADTTFSGDSLIFLPGDIEVTRSIRWVVPAGLAVGTPVNVVAKVVDFAGFATSDTLHLTVQ